MWAMMNWWKSRPKSIRLRKTYLDANERKRMSRAKEAADVA